MANYKSAFLIPLSAKKVFDDVGWLFETDDRVRPEVLSFLKRMFCLEQEKSYLGIAEYVGSEVKANVIYDDAGLIEQIYIQCSERARDELMKVFASEKFGDVEVFIP